MVAIPFINALQQSFTSEAKSKEIDLIFTSQFSNLGIEVNQEKLDMIIDNHLSNAYK